MPQPWKELHVVVSNLVPKDQLKGDLGTCLDAIKRYAEADDEFAEHVATVQALKQNQVLFHNLSYAIGLTAKHWLSARDRVLSVVPGTKTTTTEDLKKIAVSTLIAGLGAILTFATAGAAAPFLGVAAAVLGMAEKELAKEAAKGVSDLAQGQMKSAASNICKGRKAEDSMTDPFQFFLDCELSLRRVAVMMGSADWSNKENPIMNQELQIGGQTLRLKDWEKDGFWKFLFEIPKSELEKKVVETKWQIANDLIEAKMRRLAWRLYCRSLWGKNGDLNVTLSKFAIEHTPPNGWIDPEGKGRQWHPSSWQKEPVERWPFTVWKHGWDDIMVKIVNDFLGPEYFPEHLCNHPDYVGEDRRHLAKLMQARRAWISLAMVQCCAVILPDSTLCIDFDGAITLAGAEGARLPQEKYPKDPVNVPKLWFDVVNAPKASDTFQRDKPKIRLYSHVGISHTRIAKAVISDRNVTFSPTGKKGTVTSGYSLDDNRQISEENVSMPNVPTGGVIQFTLTAGGNKKPECKLNVRLCTVDGGKIIVPDAQGTKHDTSTVTNKKTKVLRTTRTTTQRVKDVTTVKIETEKMAPGIYAVTLDPGKNKYSLEPVFDDHPIYFDESVWFFRVLAKMDQNDGNFEIRWALAWIYGRTLELLKQLPQGNAKSEWKATSVNAHKKYHGNDNAAEIDRDAFFGLPAERLPETIRLVSSLLKILVDSTKGLTITSDLRGPQDFLDAAKGEPKDENTAASGTLLGLITDLSAGKEKEKLQEIGKKLVWKYGGYTYDEYTTRDPVTSLEKKENKNQLDASGLRKLARLR